MRHVGELGTSYLTFLVFFFSSRRRHTRCSRDWSSDVCSSDLVLNLIFIPGLSTKTDVGELSGRGVGMDVVKTNISKLGGIIDIYSEMGIGTKFTEIGRASCRERV